jgi:hypothetical protein
MVPRGGCYDRCIMTPRPDRIPFATRSRPDVLERAVYAYALRAAATGSSDARGVAEVVKERFPGDQATLSLVQRASTNPASRNTSGWAQQMAPDLVSDFVGALTPLSAAARLMSAGMRVDLAGKNTTKVPRRQNGAKPVTSIAWIAENAPIPVKQFVLDSVTLGPAYQLPIIAALSREAVIHSSGQQTVSTLLREDTAATLDSWMFSTQAGTVGTSPAGLLQGVTPVVASTAIDKTEAMLVDLEKLAGVIGDAGGTNVIYIAATRQERAARLRLWNADDVVIFPCASLAAGTVIAIEPNAFVSYVNPEPIIDVGTETALHFEDTSPAQLATGTGPTVATPIRSLFQQDLVAIKVVLEISYVMRATGMVSFMTSAAWGGA